MMTTIILGILAIFAFISMIDRPLIGLTLLGLLAVFFSMFRKIAQLVKNVEQLDTKLSLAKEEMKAARTVNESTDESADNKIVEVNSELVDQSSVQNEHGHVEAEQAGQDQTAPEPDSDAEFSPEQDIQEEEVRPITEPEPVSIVAREMATDSVPSQRAENTEAESPAEIPPATPRPRRVRPRQPNIFDKVLKKATESAIGWLTGGNIFVRVGIIILFMGMTFLIRYAVGQGLIPIELRLAGVAAVAIALLVWGWKQRDKKSNFALVVQGGGIGLLYLTIFASFSLYKIIDSTPAFVLLAFVVIFAAALAVLQNSKSLALFATAGGFLAPILTSSGSNNYVGLFSYYTLLNAGIFAVAWFKSWRILNFTGFVFTFAISGIWGVLSYKPEFFGSTQPFLIVFFLMYVAIAVLYALKRPPNFKDTVDSSLVFGTPLLAFVMQCELVGDTEFGIAISAFILAAFYLILASILWKRFSTRLSLLCETFLSLAVIFATIAIPFAIDGSLTGSVWAIEGAGILWVSIRQQQFYRRLFAVALIFASGVIIGWEIVFNGTTLFVDKAAFFNSAFIGTTLIAFSAAVASWLLDAEFEGKRSLESLLVYALAGFSAFMMLGGFEIQIFQFNKFVSHGHLLLTLSVLNGLIFMLWATRINWKLANWISLGYFSLLIPAAALSIHLQDRLAQNLGYLLWPLALFGLFFSLAKIKSAFPLLLSYLVHGLSALLLAGLLFWEGLWQLLAGFSIATIVFSRLGERMHWSELRQSAILFLPVLLCCFLAATLIDGDLVTLSSLDSLYYPPLKPGAILWPFAFAVYFYLLLTAPVFSGKIQVGFYYAGTGLIAIMLLWLGLWPLLLGGTALSWIAYYLAVRNNWSQMRQLSTLLLPVMFAVPIIGLLNGVSDPANLVTFHLEFQLMERAGAILWPLAFATFFVISWLSEKENKHYSNLHHASAMVLLVVIFSWMLSQLLLQKFTFFDIGHLFFIPVISLAVIHAILTARQWPFIRYQEGYRKFTLLPLALVTVSWSFVQFGSSAGGVLLPWIPVLNPIDLMQLVIIVGWLLSGLPILKEQNEWLGEKFIIGLAVYCFIWINVDIFRLVHHWAAIDWSFVKLIRADVTQTLFSLIWSVLGLIGTFFAARKAHRELWIVSASLLAVVVLKLFLIDLSAQGTVERIVSFTGVGLLLTFVGYFSPIPPKKNIEGDSKTEEEKIS